MLANTWHPSRGIRNWVAMEKFDGIRMFWDGQELRTRAGLLVNPPEFWRKALPEGVALDGEFWCGHKTFELASSIVNTRFSTMTDKARENYANHGCAEKLEVKLWCEKWYGVSLVVFDAPRRPGGILERLRGIHVSGPLFVPPAMVVKNADEVHHLCDYATSYGGEGVMLRHPRAVYAFGRRSPTMLKVKNWDTRIGLVVAYRTNALEVCDEHGYHVGVSNGLTHYQKKNMARFFPVGSQIKFRHSGVSASGTPKLPVFVGQADGGRSK